MGEAEDRKQRVHRILDARSIPWLAHLPTIETAEEAVFRSSEEIVARVRRLMAISWAAIHRDLSLATADVSRWQLESSLTPRELAFTAGNLAADRDFINFSWTCEAIVPLIWAVGLHDDLYFPDQTADMESLRVFIHNVTAEDLTDLVCPLPTEILDEADLIYRLHWATRQASLDGNPPPGGLDAGVVVERHHALNWLIGYGDNADWDDVTTDT